MAIRYGVDFLYCEKDCLRVCALESNFEWNDPELETYRWGSQIL